MPALAAALFSLALASCATPPALWPTAPSANDPPPPPAAAILARSAAAPAGAPDPYAAFAEGGVNPTLDTQRAPLSVVGLAADTASWSIALSALEREHLPASAPLRAADFINAVQAPRRNNLLGDDDTISVEAEVFPSPFRPGFDVLRVTVAAPHLPVARASDQPPIHAIFVLDPRQDHDVMRGAVMAALSGLKPDDRVTVVRGGATRQVLIAAAQPPRVEQIRRSMTILTRLPDSDWVGGLRLAWRQADRSELSPRIVLMTGGSSAGGAGGAGDEAAQGRLIDEVARRARAGQALMVVGLGPQSDYNEALLRALSDASGGPHLYLRPITVPTMERVMRMVAAPALTSLVASVRFDPARVSHYRLIGYESRSPWPGGAPRQAKGGRLAAGQQSTLIYELERRPRADAETHDNDDNKAALGITLELSWSTADGQPESRTLGLTRTSLRARFADASGWSRLYLLASTFAERLRQSRWARTVRYDAIIGHVDALPWTIAQSHSGLTLRDALLVARRLDDRPSP